MATLFLENTYSINLASNYFSKKPVMDNDWICIILYYDSIIALLKPNETTNKGLINFLEHPFQELIKTNYTGEPPYDTNEINLNAIRVCYENGYDFLLNFNDTAREEFINFANKFLPEAIPLLKDSFFKFDLLHHFIVKNIPTIGGQISKETEEKIIEFKNSDFGKAIREGIDEIANKYTGYYYITKELELQLKNESINIQQEFLGKLDFDKITKFKLGVLLEDGIGTAAGLIIPFLPLGTIKEIFAYAKTKQEFKRNKGLQFILSIFYLQKIILQEYKDQPKLQPCLICQTTEAEIMNLSNEEVHEFIFSNSKTMCFNHLITYLSARKFLSLTGHNLFMVLKSEE